jgi:hypothetical protein
MTGGQSRFDTGVESSAAMLYGTLPEMDPARLVALTQCAPGKVVWIDNKEWTSGALYAPVRKELSQAWQGKLLILPGPPPLWSFSSLRDAGACPRRYALAHAS